MRDEMAGHAPDTNTDLQDCTEEEWKRFREEQQVRLREMTAVSHYGSQCSSSVVGSNLEGMDSCTTATWRNKAESVLSDDIWRQYSFDKQDEAWKVPIIDSKDNILDIIGGKFDIC